MKPLPGCLIVLALNGISWADFGPMPSSNQAQVSDSSVPRHKHKKHTAGASVTVAPAASSGQVPARILGDQYGQPLHPQGVGAAATAGPAEAAVTAGPAAKAVSAVMAATPLMPAPLRYSLDEAVMEESALPPLRNIQSASQINSERGTRNAEGGNTNRGQPSSELRPTPLIL